MEERITSRKNPLLILTRRLLSDRAAREEAGLFAADGTKLLQEAVKFCPGLDTVILSDGVEADTPPGVRRVRVPKDVMASISPMASPQGALFLCRYPELRSFAPEPGTVLLDGIQDPGNLGTILRTANAFGVPAVLLDGCADLYNPKVIRASMGAVFRTPPIALPWKDAYEALAAAHIPLASAALSADCVSVRQRQPGAYAVVIGSEGQGVRREIMEQSEHWILPMTPNCESLNAAVAAAIVMWEMKKTIIG